METKDIISVEKMNSKDIATALSKESSIFLNVAKFEHCQRVASMLAKANMWPDNLKSIGDAMITLNLADRMQLDPLMLAQNISIIHGKPGFESKLVIALINKSGRFDPIQYEEIGDLKTPYNDNDGCIAYAKEIKSGKILKGPKIDWNMVKTEGWYNKPGSKWKTGLASLMFRYRAASYFANVYCPEVKLGMQTKEELQDIVDITPNKMPASSFEQSIENPQCSNINKKTYQPLDLPEIQPKEETQHEEKIIQHLIDSFKNKSEKGILQFAEEHKSEILTWPDKVFDTWCDKFKRTIGEDYTEWTRRPLEEKKEEIKTKGLDFVKCPDDGEHKSLAQCQNRDGQDKPCKMYQEKNCLERWPE